MVTVTEKAARRIREMLGKSPLNNPDAGIRLAVKSGGCSGFTYIPLAIAAKANVQDSVFASRGIWIFIDPKSLPIVNGTEIDLSDNLLEGFIFNNPNATSTCGCGISFHLKTWILKTRHFF